MFGAKSETDEISHLLGSAGAWGGLPAKVVIYLNFIVPENNGDDEYVLNFDAPPAGWPRVFQVVKSQLCVMEFLFQI